MPYPHFAEATLDDLLHTVMEEIITTGSPIEPSRGSAVEMIGVQLELSDPRSRLSRTVTRGKLFSCLGEFCWYLAGSNKVDFISYYIPQYRQEAEGDIVWGAYGPRLFAWRSHD